MSQKVESQKPVGPAAEHEPLCPYCKRPANDAQIRVSPLSGNIEALLIRVSCKGCHCLMPVQVTLVMAPQQMGNPTRRDSGLII
jgi:hypothetical protein